MSKRIIAALCMSAPVLAYGAMWKFINIASDGMTIEIDSSSLSTAGIYRKAWFRYRLKTPTDVPSWAMRVASGQYDHSVDLIYARCADRTTTTLQTLYYGPDNTLVAQALTSIGQAFFSEPAPDTIGEDMLNHLCAAQKRTKKNASDEEL